MKMLMISIDKGLLGQGQLGDVVERHKKYGESCDKIDIIVLTKKGFEKFEISDKVTVYPTNSCCRLKYCRDAFNLGKKLFKGGEYDLIITQTPFISGYAGLKLKKKFKTKLLVHFHGDFWKNKKWLKENKINYLLLSLSKIVVKGADAIRVMSDGQREKLGKFKDKARVISTPVDLKKYKKLNTFTGDKKIVLHVGRDDVVKDYNILIKTFKLVDEQVSNVEFWQVGSVNELKQAMEENNFSKVKIFGKQNHDKIIDIYHQSSIFVLSSTSESFGKVLVEANALGKPVVSTATTGAKEIIKDGYNGYLVPIGDAKALADKVIFLLNNPDKAQEVGENGKKLVQEKFSDNTEKIIEFWKYIIK